MRASPVAALQASVGTRGPRTALERAQCWLVTLVVSLTLAPGCASKTPDAGSNPDGGADADADPPDAVDTDEFGYRVYGEDIFPPLLERVVAKACPASADAACVTDGDCGPGMACVCGRFHLQNTCLPAECRDNQECATQACLLSLGPFNGGDPKCCSAGLYCARASMVCDDGADCPGNGRACVYVILGDTFACSDNYCNTCEPVDGGTLEGALGAPLGID